MIHIGPLQTTTESFVLKETCWKITPHMNSVAAKWRQERHSLSKMWRWFNVTSIPSCYL